MIHPFESARFSILTVPLWTASDVVKATDVTAAVPTTAQLETKAVERPFVVTRPSSTPQRPKRAEAATTRFQHALQIKTREKGYNSGRTYYLQAADAAQCAAVAASLAVCARRAREASEAKSRARRAQAAVCRVYESSIVQTIVALLIIGVCHPSLCHGTLNIFCLGCIGVPLTRG